MARQGMTAQAVFNTVKAYAAALGLDNFAPHDLRRSYAKLAHKGRAPLEQIQLSLRSRVHSDHGAVPGRGAEFYRCALRSPRLTSSFLLNREIRILFDNEAGTAG